MSSPATTTYEADQATHLTDLMRKWNRTGRRPDAADYLSRTQHAALMLMSGRDNKMQTPVLDFLLLDAWLQKLVLETWGQYSFIGRRLGVDIDTCPD